jgi:hypothetical protein
MKNGNTETTERKMNEECMRVLVCAPEAPQLAGDGDGVLADRDVGMAECMGNF